MNSMELQAEKVNVDLENQTVIITGVDVSEVIDELGTDVLLEAMDYSDVVDFVGQVEQDKADEEYDRRSDK